VAYDEELAGRIRELLGGEVDLTEKKMFGGLAFLIGGNMAAKVEYWFGSTRRGLNHSSPQRTRASWRCAVAKWRDGYGSTLTMSAPSGNSRSGWVSA